MAQKLRNKTEQTSDNSNEDWLNYSPMLSLYMHLMREAYGIQLKPVSGGRNDKLCDADIHFLGTQISNVRAYDEDGVEIPVAAPSLEKLEPDELFIPPVKVVAQLDHLEMAYTTTKDDQPETLTVTGHKWDFRADDFEEASQGRAESAKSALNMAYAAKAAGWTHVDFGETTDPIDRILLIQACKHVGLSYDGEEPQKSVVSGVKVAALPDKSNILYKSEASKIPKRKDLMNAVAEMGMVHFKGAASIDIGGTREGAIDILPVRNRQDMLAEEAASVAAVSKESVEAVAKSYDF